MGIFTKVIEKPRGSGRSRAGAALVLLAASLFAAPAMSAPPTKAELLQMASNAAGICAEHMPDTIATGNALKAAGLPLATSDGRMKFYAAHGYRIVTAISSAGDARNVCFITVSKMTPAEADALVAPWLKASNAQPLDQRGDSTRWLGIFKGEPVLLGTLDHIELGLLRGAAIVAGSPQ